MGMDVIGRQPKNKIAEYFRRNVWGWHPLADYVLQVAPDTASACKHWHTNDGDGLNAKPSVELAEVLRREIAAGRAAKYVHRRNSILATMPDEECPICEGTGTPGLWRALQLLPRHRQGTPMGYKLSSNSLRHRDVRRLSRELWRILYLLTSKQTKIYALA